MAKLTFSGPTREADAESARAAAVLAGNPVHVHVVPADKVIFVLTGADCPAVASLRNITTEDFRDRFTPAELLAVASSSDPVVKFALLKLSTKALPYVDLDNAEVIATMAHLVTVGLLTPARAAAIRA